MEEHTSTPRPRQKLHTESHATLQLHMHQVERRTYSRQVLHPVLVD